MHYTSITILKQTDEQSQKKIDLNADLQIVTISQ
jgi:hypothetical protein